MNGPFSRLFPAVAVLAVLVGGLFSATASAKPPKELDIVDTVAANKITTNFSAMIQASDLTTFLSSRGPFTLFVPTDSAFVRLPPGEFDLLLQPQNKERLQDILLYHLVNGKRLYAKDLLTTTNLVSCQGGTLTLRKGHSGSQFVLTSKIIHADMRCMNGVIHEVDTLLMPPESALPPLRLTPPPSATTNAAPAGAAPPATGDTNAPSAAADTNSVPVISGTDIEPGPAAPATPAPAATGTTDAAPGPQPPPAESPPASTPSNTLQTTTP